MNIFEARGSGESWTVFDPNGNEVRGFRHNYDAEQMADRLTRQARLKDRDCLCCSRKFTSEGPHNRMCMDCRKQTEGMI